jgi:hypothetical protein
MALRLLSFHIPVLWLKRGVKIISRDRAGTYAEAATRGAPRARQVADRYHILVNLRDALRGTLARKPESLPEVAAEREEPCSSSQPSTGSPQPSHLPDAIRQEDEPAGTPPDQGALVPGARKLTVAEQRRQISRANRLARYEQIVALHQKGLSQRMIARHLHVSRKVVRRSLTAGAFPERALTGRRQSKLDPYLPYLRKRWEEGCHNGLQLARELQAQGFRGSASLVRRLIGDWRARLPGPPERVRGKKRQAAPPAKRRLSPRQASWLFLTDQQQLTADQRTLASAHLPDQCHLPGTLSAGTRLCADGQATASAATRPMAGPGSPELLGGTAGICFWHQARLRRRSSSVVSSMESGAGGGTDHTPETVEEANVRAGSLRAPSLARPLHSLIQPPHRVRMSPKMSPLFAEIILARLCFALHPCIFRHPRT